ncbi:L-histidine N(alpha)-methyltransferase [soil metagenome]
MNTVDTMRDDVLDGLGSEPKSIPCKYFYDVRGAELFEQICELPEYYPTRTELGILESHAEDLADRLGPACRVIEYGSGSGIKIRILLEALDSPVAFTAIDISCEQLHEATAELARLYPGIDVHPLCADYTQPLELPAATGVARTVVFFPGSTIGNMEPAVARAFLERANVHAGVDGALIIGVDRRKDRETLELAYNDPAGVTAAFNLNLLDRLNRELDADFDLDAFRHGAVWDPAAGRIEMRLVSTRDQVVRVPDDNGATVAIPLKRGEWIVTEHSHKYSPDEFTALADSAGWDLDRMYTDDQDLFAVFLMRSRRGVE